MTYVFVVLGLIALWRTAHRSHLWWSWKLLAGTILIGFGVFNVVEGVIDHHLLGLHHVNETVPRDQWIYWDVSFLIWGAAMIVGGWAIYRSGQQTGPGGGPAATRSRAAGDHQPEDNGNGAERPGTEGEPPAEQSVVGGQGLAFRQDSSGAATLPGKAPRPPCSRGEFVRWLLRRENGAHADRPRPTTYYYPDSPAAGVGSASSAATRSASSAADTGLRSNAMLPISASSIASPKLGSA